MNTAEVQEVAQLSLPLRRGLIGHDSEFFLWNINTNSLVPSYEFFEQKEVEQSKSDRDRSVLFFRDGMAVEFNTQPQDCRAYLINDVAYAAGRAAGRLPSHIKFTSRPLVEFTSELMKSFPPDLKVLGCNPTFDAYQRKQKSLDVNPKKLLYRTSGSHLHMSFSTKHGETPTVSPQLWAPWVKACDLFLGVPFAYLFNDSDEFARRKLYGQAGEFRYQEYPSGAIGLEYRSLSSRLWDHPGLTSLFLGIFKYVIGDMNFVFRTLPPLWDTAWEDDIRAAINTGDPAAQERALLLWGQLFPAAMTQYVLYTMPSDGAQAFEFWNKLKHYRKEGKFKDAMSVNEKIREAHFGWNEYLNAGF